MAAKQTTPNKSSSATKKADVETGAAGGEPAANNEGSRSMKQKCCGSPARIVCSTVTILVIIAVIVMLAIYGTRTGVGGKDETHTKGTLGTCTDGFANPDSVNILTLNTFMIYCVPAGLIKCQEAEARKERAQSIGKWFKDKDYDFVLMQEIWSNHQEIRDGMAESGFCHYVMTEKKSGSGLAIFSKYDILEHSFKDWFDGMGGGSTADPLNPETWIADKGVLYAKVMKSGQPVHIFNLHANSDTTGDNHDVRKNQFGTVRNFIDSKQIPSNELVLIGGDMNEDKDCRVRTCDRQAKCEDQSYYNDMLTLLSAGAVEISTAKHNPWTYDTEGNEFLKSLYDGTEECDVHQYLLDYIFYSNKHQVPEDSSVCTVLQPTSEDGKDLSDHYPLDCVIDFSVTIDDQSQQQRQ